jgi:hypothetical protein
MRCSAILPRLFGVLLLGGVPSGLLAQMTPYRVAAGDLVRFHVVNQEGRVSGRVAFFTPDTLWLESRPNRVRSGFARKEVRYLERRVGGPSGVGTGVLVGFGLGAGFGVLAGTMACQRVCESGDNGALPLALGAILGGIGAITGGIIGAIASPSSWSLGVWPAQAGAGTAIGLRLTFRL